MTDAPAPAAPAEVWSLSPEQATATLAQKTAEYKAAQASAAGAVPPPPPGRPATSPAQAAARLAQLKADPAWREKLLTGTAAQVREFQELTALAASDDTATDVLIETVDSVSDPHALTRSAYNGLIDALRGPGGLNEISEQYLRDLDSGARSDRGTEGDKIAFTQARDRLMRDPELRAKYLRGEIKISNLMNGLNCVIALSADDGRPLSAEGKEILATLGLR